MNCCAVVIEDEPKMRTILRDNLEHEGYRVLCAESGEDGLELVLRERPEVVLLDVMLPRIDGYEVCRRIRHAGLTCLVVMISARNHERDRVAGLAAGADEYVGKPFRVSALLASLQARLRVADGAGTAHLPVAPSRGGA